MNGATTETTIYVAGVLERITVGSVTDWKHYVAGGTGVAAIVIRSSSGTNTTYYPLKDHLGSTDRITNSSGSVVVALSYDAFGKRRGSNWTGNPTSGDLTNIAATTRHGFTSHEHLDNLALVHMNGRVQDPVIGRFISPDPFVQSLCQPQSLNRMSYVWNNPLTHLDPSGYEVDDGGKPLICVNGSCGGSGMNSRGSGAMIGSMLVTAGRWREIMIQLAYDAVQLVPPLPDMPGFGGSGDDDGKGDEKTPEQCVQDCMDKKRPGIAATSQAAGGALTGAIIGARGNWRGALTGAALGGTIGGFSGQIQGMLPDNAYLQAGLAAALGAIGVRAAGQASGGQTISAVIGQGVGEILGGAGNGGATIGGFLGGFLPHMDGALSSGSMFNFTTSAIGGATSVSALAGLAGGILTDLVAEHLTNEANAECKQECGQSDGGS